jgi:hypothetical protein
MIEFRSAAPNAQYVRTSGVLNCAKLHSELSQPRCACARAEALEVAWDSWVLCVLRAAPMRCCRAAVQHPQLAPE